MSRDLNTEKMRFRNYVNSMEKSFEKINKEFQKEIRHRNEQNDNLRKELDESVQSNEASKFIIRGLTSTKRNDEIFSKVSERIGELEDLIDVSEAERDKQQNCIFEVMKIIKIGGDQQPKQKDATCQTDL